MKRNKRSKGSVRAKLFVLLGLLFTLPVLATGLDFDQPRGENQIWYNYGNIGEACIISREFPLSKYTTEQKADGSIVNADKKKELQLCSIPFHTSPEAEKMAVCAKTSSTSPALDLFEIKKGWTKKEMEKINCTEKWGQDFKKIARYKMTTSCTYTPSILGYYQLSRILGNRLHIPAAVVRSLDLKFFEEKLAVGIQYSKNLPSNSRWTFLKKEIEWGKAGSDPIDANLFDNWLAQIYGAMIDHKSGGIYYNALYGDNFHRPSWKLKSLTYKDMNSNFTLDKLLTKSFSEKNVQRLQSMQDMSEIMVMDYIMNQFDRWGNVSSRDFYYWKELENGKVKIKSLPYSRKNEEKVQGKRAIVIREAMLKDNDCGLIYENETKLNMLLENISHLRSDFYERLLAFEKILNEKDTQDFFKSDVLFSRWDYEFMSENTHEIVRFLKARVAEGKLFLDPDVKEFFAN